MARKVQAHHFYQITKRVLWLMVSGITCDRQHIVHSRTPIPSSHSHVPNWFCLGLIWSCSNWQVETAQSSELSITMIDYISFSWRNWRQPAGEWFRDQSVILSWTWSLCLTCAPRHWLLCPWECPSFRNDGPSTCRWDDRQVVDGSEPLWMHRVAAVGVAGMCLLCHIKPDTDGPWLGKWRFKLSEWLSIPPELIPMENSSQSHFSPPCGINTYTCFYPMLKVSGQKTVARIALLSNIY